MSTALTVLLFVDSGLLGWALRDGKGLAVACFVQAFIAAGCFLWGEVLKGEAGFGYQPDRSVKSTPRPKISPPRDFEAGGSL